MITTVTGIWKKNFNPSQTLFLGEEHIFYIKEFYKN